MLELVKSKLNQDFDSGQRLAPLKVGMEQGANQKSFSFYWVTWIALFVAPVVSAWGSTASTAAKTQAPQSACEDQQCAYTRARDQLVFQFLYHVEYGKKVEKFTPSEVQAELQDFCAGLSARSGKFDAGECKKMFLQSLAVNLESTRKEIHRMSDALSRLSAGSVAILPNKKPAEEPKSPEPLEFSEFKKLMAQNTDPQTEQRYWEWVKTQSSEPLPQHFPKLLKYTATERDGSIQEKVKIDRSCPQNPSQECYDLAEYQKALNHFHSKNPIDLASALSDRGMQAGLVAVSVKPILSREKAYNDARDRIRAAVTKVRIGFVESTDHSQVSAVRAIASQPDVRKKGSTKKDIHVLMKDEDMRKAIDSIEF